MSRVLFFAMVVLTDFLAFSRDAEAITYHLFNPRPKAELRPIALDRPTRTETPVTVDAGHLQVEMDFVSYTNDEGLERFSLVPFNAKFGILPFIDFQTVFNTYRIERDGPEGIGDTILRLKINLFGNDTGNTALGLLGFYRLPTADNDIGTTEPRSGGTLMFLQKLPATWGIEAMVEYDEDETFVTSAALSRTLLKPLEAYVEFYSAKNLGAGGLWAATVDGGLLYSLEPNVILDAGANVGVTEAADDLTVFSGLSFRL